MGPGDPSTFSGIANLASPNEAQTTDTLGKNLVGFPHSPTTERMSPGKTRAIRETNRVFREKQVRR